MSPALRRPRRESEPVRVLIAEDDPSLGPFLSKCVSRLGLVPLLADSLAAAKAYLRTERIGLALMDRKLKEEQDSVGLCRTMKEDPRTRSIPIIVITGLDEFEEELRSYKAGADIFLKKPIKPDLLSRYIQAFLARSPYRAEAGAQANFGDVSFDLEQRVATIGSRRYPDLSTKQFDLLYLLASLRGRAISREDMVRKLWNGMVRDKDVDVLVFRLRQGLGEDEGRVGAVRGIGYRMVVSDSPAL